MRLKDALGLPVQSDLINKPTTPGGVLRKSLDFFVLLIKIIVVTVIALKTYEFIFSGDSPLHNARMRPRFESAYSSLFKTPLSNVRLSDFWVCHGSDYSFKVEAISGNLALREDRGFRSIDCKNQSMPFSPCMPFSQWLTRCYYQPDDWFLPGCNENVWVYADPTFSKALVTYAPSARPIYRFDKIFVRIFQNPRNNVNRLDYYERGKYTYFEVVLSTAGALVAPKLLLQDPHSFQKIDPNLTAVRFGSSLMMPCHGHL